MMDPTTRTGLLILAFLTGSAGSSQGQSIQEDFKIAASDAVAGDEFGSAVAVGDGLIAVGSRLDDDNGVDSGAAYLFDISTGQQILKLLPADGAAGDQFGSSIAIGGGTVAVAAWRDVHQGVSSGSVYLFDATTGTQVAKLTPNDGAAGDEFGFAVATDGVVVAVGAKRDDDNGADSGSLYLFDALTGQQTSKVLPNDGASNDNFGEAVAIDGGIVAVGAHGDWDNGPLSGSAYLFDASTGAQLAKLLANNGASNDFFGAAIDIDDGLVAVGAWAKNVVFDHSGAAYVFDASDGSQIAYIIPSDGHDRDHFGNSISIDDGVVAIGAHQDGDNGFVSGSAYLYDALTGTQIDKLLAGDGDAFDEFGHSIAIDNGVVVVGAIGDDDAGSDSGSAYVFNASATIDLTANPTVVSAGDTMTLTTDGGLHGALNLLMVTAVNDVPFFFRVDLGPFDARGERIFSTTVPSGLSGLELTFTSFGHATQGRLVASDPESIEIQ